MDLAGEALKMAGALVAVVALLFTGVFILRRAMGDVPGTGMSRWRVLGHLRLGPGKGIVLVELAGEILVLGTTTRELTLLTRVTDEARVEQLRASGFPHGKPWPLLKAWGGRARDSQRAPHSPVEE